MSNRCEICGKGTKHNNQASFSLRHTKRTWKPNLRSVKVNVNGNNKRMSVCTRCIKSGKLETSF